MNTNLRTAAHLLMTLSAIVAVASCGGRDRDTAEGSTATVPHPATGPFSIPADDSVRALLDDGQVTLAEYDQAFFAYVACLGEHGVPHREPEFRELRKPPKWTVGIGPYRQEQSDEINRLDEYCRARYLRAVEHAWEQQEAPTESERQDMQQEVVDCFNSRTGLDLDGVDALWELTETQDLDADQLFSYVGCMQLIMEGNDIFSGRE